VLWLQVSIKQNWNRPTTRRVKQFTKKDTQDKHAESQKEIKQLRQKRKEHAAASMRNSVLS
jgi:hypothetical protein